MSPHHKEKKEYVFECPREYRYYFDSNGKKIQFPQPYLQGQIKDLKEFLERNPHLEDKIIEEEMTDTYKVELHGNKHEKIAYVLKKGKVVFSGNIADCYAYLKLIEERYLII